MVRTMILYDEAFAELKKKCLFDPENEVLFRDFEGFLSGIVSNSDRLMLASESVRGNNFDCHLLARLSLKCAPFDISYIQNVADEVLQILESGECLKLSAFLLFTKACLYRFSMVTSENVLISGSIILSGEIYNSTVEDYLNRLNGYAIFEKAESSKYREYLDKVEMFV